MKYNLVFIYCVHLLLSPMYVYASSWSHNDYAKVGVGVLGAAGLLYWLSSSSEPEEYYDAQFAEFERYDECGSLVPDMLIEQKTDHSAQVGVSSYVPTFLCTGLLGYIGYNYLLPSYQSKKTAPDPAKTTNDCLDEPSCQEDFFDQDDDDQPVSTKTRVELTTWQKVQTTISNQLTLENCKVVGAITVTSILASCLVTCWKNAGAQHAVLYEDIEFAYKRGAYLHKRMSATISMYQNKRYLAEKEAGAIVTYITQVNNKLREYHTLAKRTARSLGGYKKNLSSADMANLTYWCHQSQQCLAMLSACDQRCTSGFNARSLAQELVTVLEQRALAHSGGTTLQKDTGEIPTKPAISVEQEHVQVAEIVSSMTTEGFGEVQQADGEDSQLDSVSMNQNTLVQNAVQTQDNESVSIAQYVKQGWYWLWGVDTVSKHRRPA